MWPRNMSSTTGTSHGARMTTRVIAVVVLALSFIAGLAPRLKRARPTEHVAALQARAIEFGYAEWGYSGSNPRRYSGWKQHSSRLIPTYVFGATLQQFKNENSPYRDETRIRQLYDRVPSGTHNTSARYFDQTDVYRLQKAAVEAGKKHVVLFIFDGLDWHTTRAAAVYRSRKVNYTSGPGMGLSFQDYKRSIHDYGYFVTSPISTTQLVRFTRVTRPFEWSPNGSTQRIRGTTRW